MDAALRVLDFTVINLSTLLMFSSPAESKAKSQSRRNMSAIETPQSSKRSNDRIYGRHRTKDRLNNSLLLLLK